MKKLLLLMTATLLLPSNICFAQVKDYTHVSSPDWSDQIIYFLLTDRFNDGDPSNNDQHKGE